MNAFVSAETIADSVACLREAGTPLPATVAGLDDVALGRALWRMNADALTVNRDDEIEGYAAPAASDSAAQRVKSLAYLMQQCCAGDAEDDPLEQELFITLYKALWTATCKMTGTDENAYEAVAGGRTGTPPHRGGTNSRHNRPQRRYLPLGVAPLRRRL